MKKTKLNLIGDTILVRPESRESVNKLGIILQKSEDERPEKGEIIAVSKNTKYKFTVKKGDTILFKKYAVTDILLDGELLALMTENEVMAVIYEDDKTKPKKRK